MSRSAGPAVDLFGALAGLGEPAGGDALAVCRLSLWPLSVPWWLAVVEAVRGCALAWDARRARSDGRVCRSPAPACRRIYPAELFALQGGEVIDDPKYCRSHP